MSSIKPPAEMTCPATGHKDLCSLHFLNCPKWIQIAGYDTNKGIEVNEWNCSDAWMVHLTIENSKLVNENVAATNSFRNEMIKQNNLLLESQKQIKKRWR